MTLRSHIVEQVRGHLSDVSYARWIGIGRSLPSRMRWRSQEIRWTTSQDRQREGVPSVGKEGRLPATRITRPVQEDSDMIEVRAAGVVCRATNRGTITFGRSSQCTIKLDADRTDGTLSRVTGVFRREAYRWQVDNMSSGLDLNVDIAGGLDCRVRPGAWPFVLPTGSSGTVTIQTTRWYRLEFTIAPEPTVGSGESHFPALVVNETETSDMATTLQLDDDDLAMLAAMCEPRLLDPAVGPLSVPTTTVVCTRLNITAKRGEAVVLGLAHKFSAVLDGLLGDNQGRATDRRQRMADFAFRTRCVGVRDLRRLSGPGVGTA